MTRAYTPAEEAWLAENYHSGTINDTLDAFEREFGRRPSKSSIATKACAMRLVKDSTKRMVHWTPERVEWFRSYVPGHTESEISAEHERLFGVPLSESQIGNGKTKLGVRSGTHGGRFVKGQKPWNKGLSWDEQGRSAESQERSLSTCFKAGEVHGYAAQRMQPVGSERVNEDGYVEVKVQCGLQERPNSNFRLKHRLVYEQAHGSIPIGCNVVFADCNRSNFDPANLVAVPRSLWAVISHEGWAYHDRESLEVCVNLARLSRVVYRARCHPRECKQCGCEFAPRFPNQRTCDGCLGR